MIQVAMKSVVAVFAALGAMVSAIGMMDTLVPMPSTRMFASSLGCYTFKVTERKKQDNPGADCRLSQFGRDGSEHERWKTSLPFVPGRAIVSDWGSVLTIDEAGREGHENALVCFGPEGQILASYSLEDLLTFDEIRAHVLDRARPYRIWASHLCVTCDSQECVLQFPWGRKIIVDLRTGKITKG